MCSRLCGENTCVDKDNGQFECVCNENLNGALCDINCGDQTAPASLTYFLKADAFSASDSTEYFRYGKFHFVEILVV